LALAVRRLGTLALVVLGVVVVGAALVDTVRRHVGKHEAEVQQVHVADRSSLAKRLRSGGVDGVLYFVDLDCRLHALRLPSLQTGPAPKHSGCRALVSPSTAPQGWSLWARDTPLSARCDRQRRRVLVSATYGPSLPMIGGCGPAWRLDGSLTYVRHGAIVQFPRSGRALVLRTQAQLEHAITRIPALHDTHGWRTTRLAWSGIDRFAIIADGRDRAGHPLTLLALFSGSHVVAYTLHVSVRVTELRASPRGRYLVVLGPDGVRIYDARRPTLPLARGFGAVSGVAWSDDERWLAVARNGQVVLRGPSGRIVLPFAARDLAWTRALS
jgi:hypothetical protein